MFGSDSYSCIGLMSGTSLDGLDICYCCFSKENSQWNFKIITAETVSYSPEWKEKLQKAYSFSSQDLYELHILFGIYLGQETQKFITKNKIENLDFIASHGQTIFHQPEKKYTLQIGYGAAIKEITGITTICDFRQQDVLFGGQGAPLVPIGDKYLFSKFDACLNLGGFSNISFDDENNHRIAFDICPVNIVLNHLAKQLGSDFDKNGAFSRKGNFNIELFDALNSLPYYTENYPKSLGFEWVERNIFPLLNSSSTEENLRTFTEHAAFQIKEIFKKYSLKNILVTGGGTYNSYLIELLQNTESYTLHIPNKEIIDFKEALIFAFLGLLRFRKENNILSSVTGAHHDHCSGIIF